jgi:hypothetical protein
MKLVYPLGYHCNITYITQALKIKKETGLFEWLQSNQLQYITDVINILNTNPDYISIVKGKDKHITILHEKLYTCHYNLDEYKIIFKRRVERFLDLIKNENEIIFTRINPINCKTTESEIILFIESIKKINPNINISFLLVDTINTENDFVNLKLNIKNIIFHHRYFLYNDCKDDVYLSNNPKIYNIYYNYLIDIGFIKNEDIDINFTDKS